MPYAAIDVIASNHSFKRKAVPGHDETRVVVVSYVGVVKRKC